MDEVEQQQQSSSGNTGAGESHLIRSCIERDAEPSIVAITVQWKSEAIKEEH